MKGHAFREAMRDMQLVIKRFREELEKDGAAESYLKNIIGPIDE
jgi:hypothetical protein